MNAIRLNFLRIFLSVRGFSLPVGVAVNFVSHLLEFLIVESSTQSSTIVPAGNMRSTERAAQGCNTPEIKSCRGRKRYPCHVDEPAPPDSGLAPTFICSADAWGFLIRSNIRINTFLCANAGHFFHAKIKRHCSTSETICAYRRERGLPFRRRVVGLHLTRKTLPEPWDWSRCIRTDNVDPHKPHTPQQN